MQSNKSKSAKISTSKLTEVLRKLVKEAISEQEASSMIGEVDVDDTTSIDKTKYNTVQMLVSHGEKRRLKHLANQEGISVSNWMRAKLSKYLDKMEPQATSDQTKTEQPPAQRPKSAPSKKTEELVKKKV